MTDQTAATTSMKGGGYYSQSTRGAKDVIDNAAPMLMEAVAALPEPVDFVVEKHTPGGCTFERHAENDKLAQLIARFKPQVAVLQEQSQMPVLHPERTRAGALALYQLQ